MQRLWPLVLLTAACGAEPALTYGKQQFSDPTVSTAASNKFSCSTCHAVSASDTRPLPGYSLVDVTVRPSWWGGNVALLLDAMNQCVTDFMGGRPLAASDDKGRAIFVYLESLAQHASAPAKTLTVVQNIVDVPSGDATMGKTIWDQSCANCHGAPGTGVGRISDLASIVPKDTLTFHPTDARLVVIEKVRHGKYFMVGGFMPLYSLEALSDAQLGDVLAYLETFGLPKSAP